MNRILRWSMIVIVSLASIPQGTSGDAADSVTLGRAESLEAQALGPIASPGEMNQSLDHLADKIKRIEGYRTLFEMAYPNEAITPKTIAKAIATFDFYDGGGIPRPSRSLEIKPLGLTESEKRDLIEFMSTLTSLDPAVSVPVLPR